MAIQGSGCGSGGHSAHAGSELRSQRHQVAVVLPLAQWLAAIGFFAC